MNVKISNVLYKNITGTSATKGVKDAISLACSNSVPCEGVTVEGVDLRYGNNEAQSLCKNAKGIIVDSVKPPLVC